MTQAKIVYIYVITYNYMDFFQMNKFSLTRQLQHSGKKSQRQYIWEGKDFMNNFFRACYVS